MSESSQPSQRSGILAGGNWIIDQVKIIDVYPKHEQLANILDQSQGTGGSPYNVLLDLAKMGASFPLEGAGLVGQDTLGEYILEDCRKNKIDSKLISVSPGTSTSYTDVMTEREGGRRTFFQYSGANSTWDGSDIDFSQCSSKIFHLGYLLLLDAIDASHPEHGTQGAALLSKARAAGLKTSIDVVSEDSDRFARIIGPALKQVDYCILNEVEGSKVTGVTVREDGKLLNQGIEETASKLFELGVGELVAIHFPEGSYAQSSTGEKVWHGSLSLPKGYIKGAAGAGDAFCSGVLYGVHEGWSLEKSLLTGTCAATACMSDPTCTDGLRSLEDCLALAEAFGIGEDES
ncbi:MAG: ribokinase [Verrucomicrobia bacterium TMED60]|nr:MAG: ribokinase [Verrucomicrobia bacterium TMED60]